MVVVSEVKDEAVEEKWDFAPDKTFKRRVLQKGSGLICPRDGSICRVRISAEDRTNSEIITTRSLRLKAHDVQELIIGENDTELDYVLDKVLEFMKPAEIDLVKFQIHSEESSTVTKNTSSLLDVCLRIELVSFKEAPEIWELNSAQLLDATKHHKEKGVEWFKKGATLYALSRFAKAMSFLLVNDKLALEELAKTNSDAKLLLEEYRSLKLSLHLNIAAVQLLSGNFNSVVDNATKALEIDANNVKALYRRGVARVRSGDGEAAKKDLLAALKLEPNDAAIRKELRELGVLKS